MIGALHVDQAREVVPRESIGARNMRYSRIVGLPARPNHPARHHDRSPGEIRRIARAACLIVDNPETFSRNKLAPDRADEVGAERRIHPGRPQDDVPSVCQHHGSLPIQLRSSVDVLRIGLVWFFVGAGLLSIEYVVSREVDDRDLLARCRGSNFACTVAIDRKREFRFVFRHVDRGICRCVDDNVRSELRDGRSDRSVPQQISIGTADKLNYEVILTGSRFTQRTSELPFATDNEEPHETSCLQICRTTSRLVFSLPPPTL
jgi:hypothetical protein